MAFTSKSSRFARKGGLLLGACLFASVATAAQPQYAMLGASDIYVNNDDPMYLWLDSRQNWANNAVKGKVIISYGTWSNELQYNKTVALNSPVSPHTRYTLTFYSENGNRSFHRRIHLINGSSNNELSTAEITCGLLSQATNAPWTFSLENPSQAMQTRKTNINPNALIELLGPGARH